MLINQLSATTSSMPVIVFGAGGLIGSSILKFANQDAKPFHLPMPWVNPQGCIEVFRSWEITEPNTQIVWSAGASAVSTSSGEIESEVAIFRGFLEAITRNFKNIKRVLLVSSAGGVYGRSADHFITEKSAPNPISEYGRAKLRLESELIACADACNVPVFIARVSNAYGPMQNLNKSQGLISTLVKASLERRPLTIYVPLDTKRDYIYCDDVGKKIAKLLDTDVSELPNVNYKLIASGSSFSILSIVSEINKIRGIKTPIIFATRPETFLQPGSVFFRSIDFVNADKIQATSIVEGIEKVISHQLMSKQIAT
jgi:UDP-glucose 4-epimerase